MGKYGKGYENSSGKMLLELCAKNNMVITNTTFEHKLTNRTTWTAPMREFVTKEGKARRNPVRNEIEYIIVRQNMKHLVTNSRSYGGILTDSYHKIVIADINMDLKKIYEKSCMARKNNIDVDKFQEDTKKQQYRVTK